MTEDGSTTGSAGIAFALAVTGAVLLAGGAAAGHAPLALASCAPSILAVGRSRTLLRAIDAGDLPRDGRGLASAAWILSAATGGISPLLIALAAFR